MRHDSIRASNKLLIGNMPWHEFGLKLSEPCNAKDAVRSAHLDRVGAVDHGVGQEDLRWTGDAAGAGDVDSNHKALQNVDVFTFFDPIVDTGAAVYESIGVMGNGRWVWMTALLRTFSDISPGDSVAQFVLLAYEHGTSKPPTMSCKPVRLVGKTTLSDDLLYPLIRVTITPEGRTKFEDTTQGAARRITSHFDSLVEKFRAMDKLEFDEEQLIAYLDSVFPKARAGGRGSRYKESSDRERAIEGCIRLFLEKNEDLPNARASLWSAYSAVAHYVDYHETPLDDPKRLHEIWTSPLKRYALMQAMKMLRNE